MVPPVGPRLAQVMAAERRLVVARFWEQGKWAFLFHGHRVSVWDDENVLEADGGDGCLAW